MVRARGGRDDEGLLTFDAYADLVRRQRRYDEWTRERRMT
jgi:hypothetical protein